MEDKKIVKLLFARELKMQENAVYVRLNQLRTGLKEYLKKEGYQYEA